MKRLVLVLLLLITSVAYAAEDKAPDTEGQGLQEQILKRTWSGKRFNRAVWGIAAADVDGDGSQDIVLLERNAVRVGNIEGGAFNIKSSYEWKGFREGVRLFTINLDDDPAEEIVVSGVEFGRPSSFALDYKDGNFSVLFENQPWHLRALEIPLMDGERPAGTMKKILIGQQWNISSFFASAIYELTLKGKKLKHTARFKLPETTTIFDFAIYPSVEDDSPYAPHELVRLEGYAPLKVYKRTKKRFKKVWGSGARYGGTMNLVAATEREALGVANEIDIPIDHEPTVIMNNGEALILAIQHDIPLKNIVGRRPYVSKGNVTSYRSDPALEFYKYFMTEEIPGFISDFAVYTDSGPAKRLIVCVQPDTSAFYENQESALLIYDLPN